VRNWSWEDVDSERERVCVYELNTRENMREGEWERERKGEVM
jgi:hypothetical protein